MKVRYSLLCATLLATLASVYCYRPGRGGTGTAPTGTAAATACSSRTRLFSYAVLADLHVGRGVDDFGGQGFDDGATGQECASSTNARAAVLQIERAASAYDIEFVVVLGDLTDSAERSEFLKAREVLDGLSVPYVPLVGNHDLWPYTGTSKRSGSAGLEADRPCGDAYFRDAFDPVFLGLRTRVPGWEDGTRTVGIWNGEADNLDATGRVLKDAGCLSYFQNFAFDHRGMHFVCLDPGTRNHAASGYRGCMGEADLFDSAKCRSTWRWFEDHLLSHPARPGKPITVFTHFPLTKDVYGEWMGFSPREYAVVTGSLRRHGGVGWWFAGHFHEARSYGIRTWNGLDVCRGVETAANYAVRAHFPPWNHGYDPKSHVRIVQVFSDGTVDVDTVLDGVPEEAGAEGDLAGRPETLAFDLPFGPHTVVLAGVPTEDMELRARWGAPPTRGRYDALSNTPSALESVSLAGSGKLFVTVDSASGRGGYCLRVFFGRGDVVARETASFSLAGDTRNWQRAAGGECIAFLTSEPSCRTALRLRWNAPPGPGDYDAKSTGASWWKECGSICRDAGSGGRGTLHCQAECVGGAGDVALLLLEF